MAESRSNLFGSPIWFIYTFYTAKGSINIKHRSPMYSILDTIRNSNIKISIHRNSKKRTFLGKKFFFHFLTSTHQFICQKSDFYIFWDFYTHLFKLQGIHRENSKKGHNSVKNQNFKKQKILFLPILNTSAHAKNQVSRLKGKGCRRGTNKQTDKQTDIPRTDQRLKTYEIFFSTFIFISSLAV